jgi:hypothetical protein
MSNPLNPWRPCPCDECRRRRERRIRTALDVMAAALRFCADIQRIAYEACLPRGPQERVITARGTPVLRKDSVG